MLVTSDFECGNGKDIRRLGDRHYLVTERGDKVTYCYYFCVKVKTESPEEAGDVLIEVVGDPDLKDKDGKMKDVGTEGLMGHTPCAVWYTRWEGFRPLTPDRVEYTKSSIRMLVPVHHDDPVTVTNVVPSGYTSTVAFLKGLAEKRPEHVEYVEIGNSAEGRPIPGVRITEGLKRGSKPRAVVMSGEHPIEFPGVWGTRGIAEHLASRLAEAAEYRRQFEVVVLPLVNPDGTVRGNNNFNSRGEEVYGGYLGASEGKTPEIPESKVLWSFLDAEAPELLMNIHCYCGWGAFPEHPYNGLYIIEDKYFKDPERLERQRTVEDYGRLRTTGMSGRYPDPNKVSERSVHAQMALGHGTLGFLYEINASTHGPWGAGRDGWGAFRALADGYLAGAPSEKARGGRKGS